MKNLTMLFLLLVSVYGYSQDQKSEDFQTQYTELSNNIDSYLINSTSKLTELETKNQNDLEESIKEDLFAIAEAVESVDDVDKLKALALTFDPKFAKTVEARAVRVLKYKNSLK